MNFITLMIWILRGKYDLNIIFTLRKNMIILQYSNFHKNIILLLLYYCDCIPRTQRIVFIV